MKIYNKKNFGYGLFMVLLGVANLMLGIRSGEAVSVVTILLLVVGGSGLCRSFSQKLSREDKLNELDERNRYVMLKSKSRAFQIVQYGCLVLTGVLFGMSVVVEASRSEAFVSMGIGFAGAFARIPLGEGALPCCSLVLRLSCSINTTSMKKNRTFKAALLSP